MDIPTILEEAADLLLIEGRCKGQRYDGKGRYCVVGAIEKVQYGEVTAVGADLGERPSPYEDPAVRLLAEKLGERDVMRGGCVDFWNDNTPDDFDVIDTLRLVAKDLRNEVSA